MIATERLILGVAKRRADSRAQFRYSLQLSAAEVEHGIGTSTVLAAWNAATYVAQIEDDRLLEAMSHGCRIISTRQPPMPEFFKNGCTYYDPKTPCS